MRTMLTLTVFLAIAGTAHAADEFGARFNDGAPAALETKTEAADPILELQNIAPAAGDEAAATTTPAAKIDPATGTLTENPAQDILKLENAPATNSQPAQEKAIQEPESTSDASETATPPAGQPEALKEVEASATNIAPEAIEPAAGDEKPAPKALQEIPAAQ